MVKQRDKRSYARVATNVIVHYRDLAVSKDVRDYFDGVVSDVSLGGVFIATPSPAAVGAVIELACELEKDGQLEVIRCKAVVRWRQRWRKPTGMGVEFIELEGLGSQSIETWFHQVREIP